MTRIVFKKRRQKYSSLCFFFPLRKEQRVSTGQYQLVYL